MSPSHLPTHSCDICPKYSIHNVIYGEISTFLPILSPGFGPFDPFFGPIIIKWIIKILQHGLVTVVDSYWSVILFIKPIWQQNQRRKASIYGFMARKGLKKPFGGPTSVSDVWNITTCQCYSLIYHLILIPISFIAIKVWEIQFFLLEPFL